MTSMMVSNCSLIPTKQVEVVAKPVERVITQPIMPREIDLKEVRWLTITPENYEELKYDIERSIGQGREPETYESWIYNNTIVVFEKKG